MGWFSGATELAMHGVAAFPPAGPTPSFKFHHEGSNFIIFLILFMMCTMEVVVLKIMTEESARLRGIRRRPRRASSMWTEVDE